MKEVQLNLGSRELTLLTVEHNGEAWVAVRPICEAIGISPQTQIERIKDNPSLSCKDILATGSDGKQYSMICIPVCEVGSWLHSINANRVSPHLQEAVIEFQTYLAKVIHEALESINNTFRKLRGGHMNLFQSQLHQDLFHLFMLMDAGVDIVQTPEDLVEKRMRAFYDYSDLVEAKDEN